MADRNKSKPSEYLNSSKKQTDSVEQFAVAPRWIIAAPPPPPPQEPRHEKKVVYWEDKTTGEYQKRTVTEKATENDYIKYDTVTFGNRSTGQWRSHQTQEKYSYGSGKQEFRQLPPSSSSSRYITPSSAAAYHSSDLDCYNSDSDY